MSFLFYLSIGLVFVIVIIAVIWRAFSGHFSIPCPSWLGWLVELDNPILRINSAPQIIQHMRLLSGMKVLDLGCGPGRLAIPIAKQIGPSGMVTAFDIQAEMLARVRAKAGLQKLANIETIQGIAGEGKIRKNEYDRVLLVTVLGEIPDKEKAIQEVIDSLKPGGLLSITEVIADPHFQNRRKVMEVIGSTGFKEVEFFGNRIAYTINFEKP